MGRRSGREDAMEDGTKDTGGERRAMRRGLLFGILGSAALAGLLAARPIAAAVQEGGWHRGHGRWGHHGMNPDAAKEHVQVATKFALRGVDATEEQQEKVGRIVAAAVEDLSTLHERHRANREAFAGRLTGPTVDRAGLEELRKAELALADEASRKLVQALADAADVLTPEQRQALLEHVHRFRH
jgi:Spy/CpxP family protein refolding chaperone